MIKKTSNKCLNKVKKNNINLKNNLELQPNQKNLQETHAIIINNKNHLLHNNKILNKNDYI